ncbi:MAG: hypothetical protein JWP08_4025 [Bryobacterales bacterium]|nr:hypothetical protein [Bryobacterales bacterium]
MGLDFITKLAGKPWRKGWGRGLDELRQPTLLDMHLTEVQRLITADCLPSSRAISVGDELCIQEDGDSIAVLNCQTRVGIIKNPPADVQEALRGAFGIAAVQVVRLGTFGDSADLRIMT